MRTLLAALAIVMFAVQVASARQVEFDEWTLKKKIDEFTDSQKVSAEIWLSDGFVLNFTCFKGRFYGNITPWQSEYEWGFITSDAVTAVTWRADTSPAVTETWKVRLPKGNSTLGVYSYSADGFAKAIIAAENQFLIKVHGYTKTVPIGGAAEALEPILTSCAV